MIINAPVTKMQELTTLLCEELAGNDIELIEKIKTAITPSTNTPELDEEGVDNLIRIIKERRQEKEEEQQRKL